MTRLIRRILIAVALATPVPFAVVGATGTAQAETATSTPRPIMLNADGTPVHNPDGTLAFAQLATPAQVAQLKAAQLNSSPIGPQANYAGITCKNGNAIQGWGHSCGMAMHVGEGPWGINYCGFWHDPNIAFWVPSDIHQRCNWNYNSQGYQSNWAYYVCSSPPPGNNGLCHYGWQWNNPFEYYSPSKWLIDGYSAGIDDTWDHTLNYPPDTYNYVGF